MSKFPFKSHALNWLTQEDMYTHYYKECRREAYPSYPVGGQSCGMPVRGIRLIHDDLGFEVAICCHRSQIKNHELAVTFFKLFIDEVILPQL